MAGTIEINNFPYNLLTDDYRSDGTAPPDSPPESGGNAAMSYYAPNGFNTARKIVISSETLTFQEPEYVNFLGFGLGWMYLNPIGTVLATHSNNTMHGSKVVNYEASGQIGANRRIYSDGVTRLLRTEINTGSFPGSSAGSMINMGIGRDLTPSDFVYSFNVGRCVIGSGHTAGAGTPQLKDARIGKNVDIFDVNNSAYIKSFASGPTLDQYYKETEGSAAAGHDRYFPYGINKEGRLYSNGWLWKQNTPDVADGYHLIHGYEDTQSGYFRNEPFGNGSYGRDHIKSNSLSRPDHSKWQAYIGNMTTETDIYWDTGDFYTQVNGTIFALADNSVITSATRFIPLIPTDFINSGSVELNLYAGHTGGFEGNTIFALDSELNVLGSVTL